MASLKLVAGEAEAEPTGCGLGWLNLDRLNRCLAAAALGTAGPCTKPQTRPKRSMSENTTIQITR